MSHALVIGGSVAGLLSARILRERFDTVTLVERDHFPATPSPRRGTPQAYHAHGLQIRGRQILEELFPGLQKRLLAEGALLLDMAKDMMWLTSAGWGKRYDSNIIVLVCSRNLLEWGIRQELAQDSGVRFLEACDVLGLSTTPDRQRVTGLRVRTEGGSEGERTLEAELVVDASGRGSRTPQWLTQLGYEAPDESVVNAFLGYSSRFLELPESYARDWKAVYLQSAPPSRTRSAVLFPVEGNRCLLSLGGADRDYPPTDEEGYLEFARSLPNPIIHEVLQKAVSLTPIRSSRSTENRLRHYERLRRMPEGLLVTGDAVAAFNPVYGQGLTMAALGALTLRQSLEKQGRGNVEGLGTRFQKELARIAAVPWMLATNEDLRFRGTEGATATLMTRVMQRYMDGVMQLTTENIEVRQVVLKAINMLVPPTALFHPKVSLRVLPRLFLPADKARRESSTPSAS